MKGLLGHKDQPVLLAYLEQKDKWGRAARKGRLENGVSLGLGVSADYKESGDSRGNKAHLDPLDPRETKVHEA